MSIGSDEYEADPIVRSVSSLLAFILSTTTEFIPCEFHTYCGRLYLAKGQTPIHLFTPPPQQGRGGK